LVELLAVPGIARAEPAEANPDSQAENSFKPGQAALSLGLFLPKRLPKHPTSN